MSAAMQETDNSTRERVVRSILGHGPSTARELAERLNLTPAAIRRHLSALLEEGTLGSREQRVYGARGRGARVPQCRVVGGDVRSAHDRRRSRHAF